jgi:chemotaxis protein methyltransferase CheR
MRGKTGRIQSELSSQLWALAGPLPLTDDDFARLRALIYRFAGISLAPGKKDLVYSRLARRIRTRKLDSFAAYIRLIEGGDQAEIEAFINAMTTNMTSFFRETHHFHILAEHLGKLPKTRPISIWTCASSSGEEPYSIAMTVQDQLPAGAPPARILATDIDTNMLKLGEQGIYPLDLVQKIPDGQLKRYFQRGEGEHEGFARVKQELKSMVTFQRLNLLDERWPMREKFDAIFCRNVMIYFDRQTQYAILKKLAPYLKPDGLFFAGHSESFHHATDLFKLCGKTVYSLRH